VFEATSLHDHKTEAYDAWLPMPVDLLGSDWGQPASCRITGLEALSEDQEPARPSTIGGLSRPAE
jgi:hypothetical protein